MTKQELETCIHEYGTEIYSFCKGLTGNRQEADDLYQDTFLKAIELSGRMDVTGNPKSYLLSIAIRIWKNKKRKFAWRQRIADTRTYIDEEGIENLESDCESAEDHFVRQEEIGMVRKSVEHLPERLKVVTLLFYMEELSITEIAQTLKIPQGTVKSRLHQAREILAEELEVVLNERIR